MTERCIFILIILAAIFAPGCSDNPVDIEPETLSYFEISAPPAVGGGDQFDLTVEAVGSRGTKPFRDFSGTVLLTVSDGEITPGAMAISGGHGEVIASVTGTAGWCEITASAVGKTGLAYMTVLLDSIPGDPGALVADAIPDIRYRADYRNFSNDHPSLGGMFLSFNSLAVVFAPGTTVGEANAVLAPIGADIAGGIPGSAGSYEGLLALRLSTSTHAEMESALSTLRGHTKVARAVQDILMALDFTPKANGGNPADWNWNNPPSGANWNLERIRVPQMWNLNEAVRKRNNTIETLVIDRGFAAAHPDLDFTALNAFTVAQDHGAHVAGIISAKVDNGAGVDGVNPFASLRLYEFVLPGQPAGAGLTAEYDWRLSVHDAVIWTLRDLIAHHPGLRVINMSMGYKWSLAGINSQISTDAQLIADTQGKILADMIQQFSPSDLFPLIVVSAGNDSYGGSGIYEQYALYNSPMCNAALSHGTREIIVVEAVENAPGVGDGEASRCFFSNIGGHVSAPGEDIWSLTVSAPFYKQKSGTSMASPHVAGLAGFLLAIDPDLSYDDIKELMVSNAKNIPSGAARIDAWASAVDIDRIRGGDDVLRMLCDIDDGTEDGNLRIVLRDNTVFTDSDADADGGRGDGAVDMSDFRRWRDWLNQAAGTAGLALDGGAAHIKRDLNGDGRVENAALENVYPIGDFNGDGKLSLADASRVPGAINAEATDLEVLQAVFNDPNYEAADLNSLVASADFTVDLTSLFRTMGENQAVVEFRRATDGGLAQSRTFHDSDPVQIFTVAVAAGGYRCSVTLGGGREFTFNQRVFSAGLCGDEYLRPLGFWHIDPRGTFLMACEDPTLNPVILGLNYLDVEPGDRLLFSLQGDFDNGNENLYRCCAGGVFSATATLMAADNRYRVPDAIDVGENGVGGRTWRCGNLDTHIPEGFNINPSDEVTVPANAAYLMLGVVDMLYSDNNDDDGNYGMEIYLLKRN